MLMDHGSTNVRSPSILSPSAVPSSRGQLLKSFLSSPPYSDPLSIYEYLEHQHARATEFEGFNLVLFRLPVKDSPITEVEVGYLSNRPGPTLVKLPPQQLHSVSQEGPGKCFGLSNTPMAEPWLKVTEGEQRMSESLQEWTKRGEDHNGLVQRMMTVLQQVFSNTVTYTRLTLLRQTVPLRSLADAALCTCLEPIRIGQNPPVPLDADSGGRWYGTRVSTVILVKNSGEVTFVERDIGEIDEQGRAKKGTGERYFTFDARGQHRR